MLKPVPWPNDAEYGMPPQRTVTDAPPGYDCLFCRIAADFLETRAVSGALVLADERVFAGVPLHYYGTAKGNCLVIPHAHHENLQRYHARSQ